MKHQVEGQDKFATLVDLARSAWAAGNFNVSLERAEAIVIAHNPLPP
jgi:hypothetical protein